MTKHTGQLDGKPITDQAARREYVRKWIARQQRKLAVGLGGTVLMLPLLAEAQTAGMVDAASLQGVRSVQVNPDGSAQITLTNGQVVNVGAAEVQIAADGTVMISSAAAELVAELALAAGPGLAGAGAGALAGLGGLAVAAAAAGSGGGDGVPEIAVLNSGAFSGASPAIASAVFSSFPELQEGDRVFISIGEDGEEFEVEINEDGAILFPADLDLSELQGPQSIAFRVTREVEVPVLDEDGEPVLDDDGEPQNETVQQQVAAGSANAVIDTIPPEITITTPISDDDVLNAAEQGENLVIEGTAERAEDGQIVTLTFNGVEFTAAVAGEAWSVTIPAATLGGLADDATVEITANVSDAAGNPAEEAAATITTDFTAELTLNEVVIETLNKFIGVEISGSSEGVEEGRTVTVTFDGTDYTTTTQADGTWSVDIPAAVIDALADETAVAISASVSDAAGNPASDSTSSTTDFSTPALAITSPVSGGFLNADTIGNELVVSGSAIEGSVVTVTLNGLVPKEVTADEDNRWTVTYLPGELPEEDGPFDIDATTELGNTEINAPTVTLTIDTVTPDEPTLSLANDTGAMDGLTSDGEVAVSGLEAGATAEYSTDGGTTWIPFEGNSFTLEGDGDKVVIARQTDAAGNTSANSSELEFTLDTTAPDAPMLALQNDTGAVDGLTSDGEITVSGLEADSTREYSTDGGTTWISFTGNSFTLAGDGEKSVIVRQIDGAGNVSGSSTPLVFTLDTVAPATPTLALTEDTGTAPGQTSNGEVSVSGLEDGAIREYSTDGGGLWVVFEGDTITLTGDGEKSIIVRQTDGAGNVSDSSDELEFTLDTTPPVITITSLAGIAAGGELTAADLLDGDNAALDSITLAGTTDFPSDATVVITVSFGDATLETTVNGGDWVLEIPATTVTAQLGGRDSVTIVAETSDGAGNTGTGSLGLDVDLSVPSITIDAPEDGFVIGLDEFENGLTISGTTENVAEGQIVTITVKDGPDDDEGFEATATVGADGSWSLFITPQQVQGAEDQLSSTLSVSVTDPSFPIPATASIGISTDIPPQITVDPIGEDGALIIADILESGAITFSGTTRGVQEGQRVTLFIDEGDGPEPVFENPDDRPTVDANGNWTVTINDPNLDGVEAGRAFKFSAQVSNASGRSVETDATVVAYAAADYMLLGASVVTVGPAAGALEFVFRLDPRTELPDDFGIALGEALSFNPEVASYAAIPAPQYIAGLTSATNTEGVADGKIIFGGVGFLNPFDAETGEPIDLFSQNLIRFRLFHDNIDEAIVLGVESQVGGTYDFVYGTNGADTITAGVFDATLRGRGGNDQIDVSAPGVNTIIFEGGSVANGFDTVTGFTLGGALADRFLIAFDTFPQDVLRGAGTDFQVTSGGAVGADVGLLVFTTALSDLGDATIETAIGSLTGLSNGDNLFVLIGDGTDAVLTAIEVAGGTVSVSTGSGTAYARFEGIGDLAGFTSANILGFEQHNV